MEITENQLDALIAAALFRFDSNAEKQDVVLAIYNDIKASNPTLDDLEAKPHSQKHYLQALREYKA